MNIIILSIIATILAASIVGLILLNIKNKIQQAEIERLKQDVENRDAEIDKLNKIENLYKKCVNDIYYYSEGLPVFKALGDYRSILVDAYSNNFKKGTTVTLYPQIMLDEYLNILTTNIETLIGNLKEIDTSLIDSVNINWEEKESVNNAVDKLKEIWENVGISEEDARDSYKSGRNSNKGVLRQLQKVEVTNE